MFLASKLSVQYTFHLPTDDLELIYASVIYLSHC